MTISRVIGRANRIDVERQHSRSVRAIYEHIDSTPRKLCDNFADGKNQASLAGDMINERQPSSGSGRLQYLFDDEVRIRNRERNLRDDHVRSAALSYEIHRIPTRVVTMIGDQNLVTGIELKRAQHGVDASCRIGNENEIIRIRANETGQFRSCRIQHRFQFAHEKIHRLMLETAAKFLLKFQNGLGATAE